MLWYEGQVDGRLILEIHCFTPLKLWRQGVQTILLQARRLHEPLHQSHPVGGWSRVRPKKARLPGTQCGYLQRVRLALALWAPSQTRNGPFLGPLYRSQWALWEVWRSNFEKFLGLRSLWEEEREREEEGVKKKKNKTGLKTQRIDQTCMLFEAWLYEECVS